MFSLLLFTWLVAACRLAPLAPRLEATVGLQATFENSRPQRENGTSDGDRMFFAALFARAQSWSQFLGTVRVQRDLWLKTTAEARVPEPIARRLHRVSRGLQFLIVAEDWCPDSVNTVPYIVSLASAAQMNVKILDRTIGQAVMDRHRTSDGRAVTPTVVLLRDGQDVGAWVERPAVLQQMFRGIATNATLRDQFAQRQSWYDADRGQTTLSEIVALAEQTAAR